jgi:hypothetical protein
MESSNCVHCNVTTIILAMALKMIYMPGRAVVQSERHRCPKVMNSEHDELSICYHQ